jgi:hypothetical protein
VSETLTKLRPDRELQCYFQQPSAVAALSQATADGFHVSGTWRQQWDWAVVEWSRDNVFEHPALRSLPDGDLSGVQLTYEETRTNCVAIDSTTYDPIGWSCLRIWEESGGEERFHKVMLREHATAVAGDTVQPTAEFELQGSPTPGDYVELAWLDQHANWFVTPSDTLETIVAGLAVFINQKPDVSAEAVGTTLRLTYTGMPGANGKRVGVYGGVWGAQSEVWAPASAMFSGGQSPSRWRVELDFANLRDEDRNLVPTANVRRMRWTWAPELQFDEYQRTEFDVAISNWQVTGARTERLVAGPGSRRIDDDGREMTYAGTWTTEAGNYSGASIRRSQSGGAAATCAYDAAADHLLFVGTRYTNNGAAISIQVDDGPAVTIDTKRALEDVLVRLPLGPVAAGRHTISVTHAGVDGQDAFFDFLEIALPSPELPEFPVVATTTLATDWDTDHSLAIAPERTAWLIHQLGFRGRANHYAGAMWFYELANPAQRYASATIEFAGAPLFGGSTTVTIAGDTISHLNLIGDTAERIAKCFELLISAGTSAVWARAEGATLRVTSRAMGIAGNAITLAASTSGDFTATLSSTSLAGGIDGDWLTDVAASPRLNRAVRDWTRAYVSALRGYGIDAAVAFSMELRHGDARPEAAIAQRYPDGPCLLNTPALQTNFGPQSTAFWRDVYREMADVMGEAGATPYLQFGEVQWWYFANAGGMPFYDDYTKTSFRERYGTEMALIPDEHADPSLFASEVELLPDLIGVFTDAVMTHVRETHPDCRFEVLYPPDTNNTPLCRAINYAAAQWTPAALACLKTENFTFTGNRDLNLARMSIGVPAEHGFPAAQRSHLIGIGDPTAPWRRERALAIAAGVESVVLFALDQFCLIGYSLPLDTGAGRSLFMGTA